MCVMYLPLKYHSPGRMAFSVCILIPDSVFQGGSILGRDSGVAHLSWGKVGCLGTIDVQVDVV